MDTTCGWGFSNCARQEGVDVLPVKGEGEAIRLQASQGTSVLKKLLLRSITYLQKVTNGDRPGLPPVKVNARQLGRRKHASWQSSAVAVGNGLPGRSLP